MVELSDSFKQLDTVGKLRYKEKLVSSVNGYRPVVVMHGILSSYDSMTNMVQFIQKAHPGTEVLNVDAYNDADSVSPMWDQVNGVQSKIQSFVEGAPDGVHMICYSQAFKSNFLKVQRLVLIGGPDDGVITPWESSFYPPRFIWLHNLQNAGKITAYTVPGIQHTEWPNNQDVFSTYIEPWLD
eukprot:Em0013g1064a